MSAAVPPLRPCTTRSAADRQLLPSGPTEADAVQRLATQAALTIARASEKADRVFERRSRK